MSGIDDMIRAGRGRRRGLTPEERQGIDLALLDIYRAAWESERDADPTLLRAAYIKGRVDQESGVAPFPSHPTTKGGST